ncbi:MAG TPA: permease, partial [Chthoniobacteraceae bacterium]|nr:permease [Chthoniobacteraceae bacterium]
VFEGIPFLLLGSLVSGAVEAFVPGETITRWLPKNYAASIVVSALMGLVIPMCECGSVVVIRRLIRKGLPLPCAITYMMAAPIVSPIVAISTYAAFRGQNPLEITLMRLTLGFLIAVGVGMFVRDFSAEKLLQPAMLDSLPTRRRGGLTLAAAGDDVALDLAGPGLRGKLFRTVQSATADFLDVTFFFVIGAAIASTFNTAVNQSLLTPIATNPTFSVVAMMVLAFALALCSSTDAFIAVSFRMFPPAAKLAFLVFGPIFDTKLVFLYSAVFRRWFVATLAIGLFITIALVCNHLGLILNI